MIAVVGGGISGLATGRALVGAGHDVTVLEASDRPGGVIVSTRLEGRVLDAGPQRTRLTPPLRALIEPLGLADRLLTAPSDLPLYIFTDGRLRTVPMDLAAVLATDLIAWPDRIRALLEPFTDGVRPDESAADFFSRKFGRRTYRRAIAPLFGGLFASDPARMRARHALAQMLGTLRVDGSLLRALVRGARSRDRAPACTFDGGLQTLTDALARSLGPRLRLATPVRSLHRDDCGLRVRLDDDEIAADRVVLACPPDAASRLLTTLDPGAADRIGRLRVNRLATVHMESAAQLGAMGYQVALDEGLYTHGVTSQHDLFGRTGLYTAFLGGACRPDIRGLSDEELAGRATAEFEAATGAPALPLAVGYTAIPAWDDSWDALDDLVLPPGVAVCSNWTDRPGITGRLLQAGKVAAKLTSELGARRGGARSEPGS